MSDEHPIDMDTGNTGQDVEKRFKGLSCRYNPYENLGGKIGKYDDKKGGVGSSQPPKKRFSLAGRIEGINKMKTTKKTINKSRPAERKVIRVEWKDKKFGQSQTHEISEFNKLIRQIYSLTPDSCPRIPRYDCVYITYCIYMFNNDQSLSVEVAYLEYYLKPIAYINLFGGDIDKKIAQMNIGDEITNRRLVTNLNGPLGLLKQNLGGFLIFTGVMEPVRLYDYNSRTQYLSGTEWSVGQGKGLCDVYRQVFNTLILPQFGNGIYIVFCEKREGGDGHYHCILKRDSHLYFIDPQVYPTARLIDGDGGFLTELCNYDVEGEWLIALQLPPVMTSGGSKQKRRKKSRKSRRKISKKSRKISRKISKKRPRKSRRKTLKKRPRKTSRKTSRKTLKKRSKRSK